MIMLIKTRLKYKGRPSDTIGINFLGLPRQGEKLHKDEYGNGINGLVEEIIWKYSEGIYIPWVIVRCFGADLDE